ncbi:MAG: hypothetical protein BHW56_07495 [Acetobacter sp. 46_36]|nr:MAG: hypothetical protein BHW56_07495 [Acetobacter sp. 46_36]
MPGEFEKCLKTKERPKPIYCRPKKGLLGALRYRKLKKTGKTEKTKRNKNLAKAGKTKRNKNLGKTGKSRKD